MSVCSVCSQDLEVIGSRGRKIKDRRGKARELIIRRLRCKSCRIIHHELPDVIIPYKRHCAQTIEKIIGGTVEEVCCEESTIHRIKEWWAKCRVYFASVIMSLKEKYGRVFSERPTPKEIVRAVANAHMWEHTRTAFLSG